MAGLGLASVSQAQLINASFEEPVMAQGSWGTAGLPGWTNGSGDTGAWNIPSSSFFVAEAPHGTQIGYSNSIQVAQQSSVGLIEGLNEVTVMGGRRQDSFAGSFDLQLWVGGTVVNGTVIGGEMLSSTSFVHTTIPVSSFTLISTSFTAAANDPRLGQLLTVRFFKTSGSQMNWDDVRMSAVPEPMTMVGLGAFALLLRRRKKA